MHKPQRLLRVRGLRVDSTEHGSRGMNKYANTSLPTSTNFMQIIFNKKKRQA